MAYSKRMPISAVCIASGVFISAKIFADDSSNKTQSVELQSGQSKNPDDAAKGDSLVGFFAIGVVINIALVAAYFIWAYRQWKRKK
jgi:hypothetical protein